MWDSQLLHNTNSLISSINTECGALYSIKCCPALHFVLVVKNVCIDGVAGFDKCCN